MSDFLGSALASCRLLRLYGAEVTGAAHLAVVSSSCGSNRLVGEEAFVLAFFVAAMCISSFQLP